jgi:glutaredoxin
MVRWARAGLWAALAGACAPAQPFDAEQIDRISNDCRRRLDSGHAPELRRSETRGFRRQPRGGPRIVTIFGAEWCEPCHAAAAYLARRGIPHVKKDIERDAAAEAELIATLRDAGLPVDLEGLPVIDVDGVVTIGFVPCVIEQVWRRGARG